MHIRIRKWVKIVLIMIAIIACFILYSRYIGTKGLKVKEFSIINQNLPQNFHGTKIVQLSDIHYKVTTNKEDLKKIVDEINLLKPDIVILSGDLFDKNIEYSDKDFEDLIEILSSIDYNINKYAIKGEHDLNIESWNDVIDSSEFKNLNDTYDIIYNNGLDPILLVGISSNYEENHIKNDMENILNNINIDVKFSILTLHEADFINEIDYSKFNLILAGHTHNGQIVLPFINGIINNEFSNVYTKEYYDLGNTKLYISSGIGTSKYKIRFLNKPSINIYRLRNN